MSLPHASELKGAHVYLYISFVFPKFSRDIQYVSLIILYVKFDSSVFWGSGGMEAGGWGLGGGEGLKEICEKVCEACRDSDPWGWWFGPDRFSVVWPGQLSIFTKPIQASHLSATSIPASQPGREKEAGVRARQFATR